MNCGCNPPQPAALRTVTKAGKNNGREFFSCQSGKCDFFKWCDEDPIRAVTSSLSNRTHAINQQPTSKPGMISIKLTVSEFEDGPPPKVWFSAQSVSDPRLENFYKSLNPNNRKFNNTMKMWQFDLVTCYEHVVSTLLSHEFSSFVSLTELPKFLIKGIPLYLSKLPQHIPTLNLCTTIADTLLPFQQEGVQYVVRHGGRGLIAGTTTI
jgi:hypothetical protein